MSKDNIKYNYSKESVNDHASILELDSHKAERFVDLSYCSQSHRFFIRIDLFKNGEAKLKSQAIKKRSIKQLLCESFTMPLRNGEIYQQGMTNKAKGKIKLASRLFQHQVLSRKEGKAYASFITLTYGLHYPSDHLSKSHLDNFIKRLKRKHPNLQYIWVIEKQKRGAPHFHILTPEYIDKEFINKCWNGVVAKWQKSNINQGVKQQQVYPNIGKVFEAGKYMTKYMQKEGQSIGGNMYGIDQTTREQMKSRIITIEANNDLSELTNNLSEVLRSKDAVIFESSDFNKNKQYWISELNEFNLNEFLNYTVPELQLKLHKQ